MSFSPRIECLSGAQPTLRGQYMTFLNLALFREKSRKAPIFQIPHLGAFTWLSKWFRVWFPRFIYLFIAFLQ